ncbi:AbrB/MazE/SpoVT family DNA-binding domain-containing protein [Vibrio vulnificus]
MRTKICRVGNSLGCVLAAPILRELGLSEGEPITVNLDTGQRRIMIEPVRGAKKWPFSEQYLTDDLEGKHGS